MKKMIIALFVLCSCSSSKELIMTNKDDYLLYNGDKFIQTHVTKINSAIGQNSSTRIVVKNQKHRAIYIFSTIINNENMLYSKNNIKYNGNELFINSYYEDFMKDSPHSGLRKFSFVELLPLDSLIININKEKIDNIKPFKKVKLAYYYFEKENGFSGDGLLDISKTKIKENYGYTLIR